MRMNDNFNIITGQIKPRVVTNTQNRRFASLEVIRNIKQNRGKHGEDELQFNNRKLGTAQDSKLFQYSYLPRDMSVVSNFPSALAQNKNTQMKKKHSQPISLMNATKVQYNLINHATTSLGQPQWDMTKKKNPVSKFTDLGRIYAPNYSEAYKQQTQFGKKVALCNTICQIQRSYGTDKFFRKFK